MNTFIDVISTMPIKDKEGFSIKGDNILASVRAYKEDRHGSERWTNMASFSTASCLFRFRKIPGLKVTNEMFIVCEDGRYQILSAEDVRNRGMYVEALAEKLKPTVR